MEERQPQDIEDLRGVSGRKLLQRVAHSLRCGIPHPGVKGVVHAHIRRDIRLWAARGRGLAGCRELDPASIAVDRPSDEWRLALDHGAAAGSLDPSRRAPRDSLGRDIQLACGAMALDREDVGSSRELGSDGAQLTCGLASQLAPDALALGRRAHQGSLALDCDLCRRNLVMGCPGHRDGLELGHQISKGHPGVGHRRDEARFRYARPVDNRSTVPSRHPGSRQLPGW
jgi:hypothetical protein